MVAANVGDDGFVHLVTADADAGGIGKAAQAEHRNFGGAAADIDDHAADRLGDRHTGADRRRHRLLDQIDLGRAGVVGGIADGAFFDASRSRWHADDDFREARQFRRVDLGDEIFDHLLGDVDIGDDAIAQRPDAFDVARRLAHHHLGFVANGLYRARAANGLDGDDRRLVQHDTAAADIDQRVGRPQIDCHILAEERKHPAEQRHGGGEPDIGLAVDGTGWWPCAMPQNHLYLLWL